MRASLPPRNSTRLLQLQHAPLLVTDAMHMVGLPDGRYPWTNGEGEHFIVKNGGVLELEETGAIAGR